MFIGIGEILIDFISMKKGVRVRDSPGFYKFPGGAPANTTVGIARLGYPAGFITKVGDDEFGYFLVDVLKKNNVDTSQVKYSKEARTALAFVSIDEHGERSFEFYRHPAADQLLRPEEISEDYIKRGKMLHFGSVGLAVEPSRSAHLQAIKYAKKHGLYISFDPNIRENLWPDPTIMKDVILDFVKYADIFLPSEEEVITLFGSIDNCVQTLTKYGVKIIVIKQGARGATAFVERKKIYQPSYKTGVESTVGAGDAFNAGFLYSLLKGFSIEEALDNGAACAARVITKKGAMSALPTYEELLSFKKEHKHAI